MSNSTTTSGGGVGFLGLLAVGFIMLKLAHVISWSWWWVLAPLWIPAFLFLAIILMALIVMEVRNER